MKILELFRIAFSSISSNKMRSLLTMLGLIIGISSVVTIVSIGQGSQNQIESSLSSLGINNVSIQYNRSSTITPNDRFEEKDIEYILSNFSNDISGIAPNNSSSGTVIGNIDETSINLNGANEYLSTLETLTMLSGRLIMEDDVISRKNVIIIDSDLSTELFGKTDSAGEKIIINTGSKSVQFFIIGVYEKEEDSFGFSSSIAYIPYSTLDKIFNLKGKINSIAISMTDEEKIESTTLSIIGFLERIHSNSGEDKYDYFSLSDRLDTVTGVLGQVTLLISSIAGISLVVGGIGVMNIMLVSVTERTREIGIRKALGATRFDILIQFLIEAISICILGGIIGVGFGYAFTKIAENLMSTSMTISIESVLLATVFSTAIGVLFGVYPANKASKLDPIEALRYE